MIVFGALRPKAADVSAQKFVIEAEQALKLLFRVDATLNVAKVCGFYPLQRETDRQRLILALRKAGMPE